MKPMKDSPVYHFPPKKFQKSMDVCSKCEHYQRSGYLGRWNWESGMIHHEKKGQHLACHECKKILEHMVLVGTDEGSM